MVNRTQFLSLKNINVVDVQNLNKNNKINSLINTRNNSFLEEVSKNKGKTKDFFYPEQNIQLRNDNHDLKKKSLLTSFMNNSKYKVSFNQKLSLSQNNFLPKYKSVKNIKLNNNRTYYNSNSSLKQISLTKNSMKFRNLLTNLSNNNTLINNEDNKSNEKINIFKSIYPKKKKNLKLNDEVINNFNNQELKFFDNKRIPKLLMNHALIYNTVIDKILLLKNKKNILKNPILLKSEEKNNIKDKFNENNKLYNKLDALAFDDIINDIKNSKIMTQKKNNPVSPETVLKNRIKLNNIPLPRTTYNFYMKKNKKF
jgi:hypothetical protein